MGQYFIAVNKTRREYFTAWEIGGTAKLFEWCANRHAGVLAYLLRKSNETGGGDIDDPAISPYAGLWAGDEVYLVGDYDSSQLYELAQREFRNIAKELVDEYNEFIQIPSCRLEYTP